MEGEFVSVTLVEVMPGERWISSEKVILGRKAYLRGEDGVELATLLAANEPTGPSSPSTPG